MDRKASREHARGHVSPKLRRSLRLYLVISVVMLAVVVYETIHYHAIIWQVGLGLLAGIVIGIVFARMYKLSWDKDAQHVTNNIDIYGGIILGLYIMFELFRENLVHVFTQSAAVPAISLALLAGTMYGRVLGNSHVIVKLLKEQKVFSRLRIKTAE